MPDYREIISQRERFSERSQKDLLQRTKALQGALYSALTENLLDRLETDSDGRLKLTVANQRRVAASNRLWASYRRATATVGKWLVGTLSKLFGLNTAYFNEVATVTGAREERAARLLFLNLGYDLDTKEVVADSWLDSLLAQNDVKRRVMTRINTALQSRMKLSDFRRQFRDDLLDTKTGLGLVTKDMDFHAGNIFQAFDRSAQNVYRQELGLKYAIYSGTIKKPTKDSSGTRDFCWRRVGNLYDADEIESWNAEQWAGKIPGADVWQAAGGYRCRHHFSVISEELAKKLIEDGKELNRLNPPKPRK